MGGKRKDDAWNGFVKVPIKNAKKGEKQYKVQCLRCNKIYSSNAYEFLDKHRVVCAKRQAHQATKPVTSPPSNTVNSARRSGSFSSDTYLNNSDEDISANNSFDESLIGQRMNNNNIDNNGSPELDEIQYEPAPKRRMVTEDSTEEQLTEEQLSIRTGNLHKHLSVWKFVMGTNLNEKYIHLHQLQNFIRTFDPHYKVPAEGDFKTIILQKCVELIHRTNKSKKYLSAAQIITYEDEYNISLFSVLLCAKEKPTYISFKQISKDHDVASGGNDAHITHLIEEYCDEVVRVVDDNFGILLRYIIHESAYNINSNRIVDDHFYCVYKSVDCLINHLIHFPLEVSDDDSELYQSFINDLKLLLSNLDKKHVRLFEATEQILAFKTTHAMFNHPIYGNIIQRELESQMSDVYYVSNLFHPRLHGHYFDDKAFNSCRSFFSIIAPEDACNGFGYYVDKDGDFKLMYDNGFDKKYETFWKKSKMFKYAPLCDFALDILGLPAVCTTMDVEGLCNAFEYYENDVHPLAFSSIIGEV